MNTKYQMLNEKIKSWYKNKEQDELILRVLYNQIDLQENSKVDRTEDLKKETKFSNISNEEFVSLFKEDKFNGMQTNTLKHLFQELHNRYMAQKGFEVTRNVAVVKDPSISAYGYVTYNDDLLFVNKHAINKAKNVEPDENHFNKTNMGTILMFIMTHESHHVAQYETVVDYALEKNLSQEDAFLGAMGIIKNTNFEISAKNNDGYIQEWMANYDYRYVEHNANFSAFKQVDTMLGEEDKKGKPYDQYNLFASLISLRERRYDKKFIRDRIDKIEEVALKEIEYFDEGTADCPIKKSVMETVNSFMEVDEKGNSPFRSLLKEQITMLCKAQEKARENLDKYEQDENLTLTN